MLESGEYVISIEKSTCGPSFLFSIFESALFVDLSLLLPLDFFLLPVGDSETEVALSGSGLGARYFSLTGIMSSNTTQE